MNYYERLRPRPTMYGGVQMRSRYEAAWAEQFDIWGVGWEYEPRCFASPEGQYLPDFRIVHDSLFAGKVFSDNTWVEVKPYVWTDEVDQFQWVEERERILGASDLTAHLVLGLAGDGEAPNLADCVMAWCECGSRLLVDAYEFWLPCGRCGGRPVPSRFAPSLRVSPSAEAAWFRTLFADMQVASLVPHSKP